MVRQLCQAAGMQKLTVRVVKQGQVVAAFLSTDRDIDEKVLGAASELQRSLTGCALLAARDRTPHEVEHCRFVGGLVRAETEPQGKQGKQDGKTASAFETAAGPQLVPDGSEFLKAWTA